MIVYYINIFLILFLFLWKKEDLQFYQARHLLKKIFWSWVAYNSFVIFLISYVTIKKSIYADLMAQFTYIDYLGMLVWLIYAFCVIKKYYRLMGLKFKTEDLKNSTDKWENSLFWALFIGAIFTFKNNVLLDAKIPLIAHSIGGLIGTSFVLFIIFSLWRWAKENMQSRLARFLRYIFYAYILFIVCGTFLLVLKQGIDNFGKVVQNKHM